MKPLTYNYLHTNNVSTVGFGGGRGGGPNKNKLIAIISIATCAQRIRASAVFRLNINAPPAQS